jgi:hypothetical protein
MSFATSAMKFRRSRATRFEREQVERDERLIRDLENRLGEIEAQNRKKR